jgi:hypothetical protein
MSMSVATKYAAYLVPVVGNMVTVEKLAKGLATTFHEKVSLIVTESLEGSSFDGKEASALYVQVCKEVEEQLQAEVDKAFYVGASLSSVIPNWRQYKSIYKNGLLMGLNPADYPSFSKYKQAKDSGGLPTDNKETKGNAPASDGGGGSNESGTTTVPAVAVPDITSNLPQELRDELNHGIATLAKLFASDPEAAKNVVDNFNGACYAKLRKAGGRFAKLATK